MSTPLSPEELLMPQYKVIAPYPTMRADGWEVGSIIKLNVKLDSGAFALHDHDHFKVNCWFQEYPHLFKKLEWWEGREIEEMMGYVKNTMSGYCFKVSGWRKEFGDLVACERGSIPVKASWLIPITKEEFDNYKKSLKNETR